jgi:hypothetical protein
MSYKKVFGHSASEELPDWGRVNPYTISIRAILLVESEGINATTSLK